MRRFLGLRVVVGLVWIFLEDIEETRPGKFSFFDRLLHLLNIHCCNLVTLLFLNLLLYLLGRALLLIFLIEPCHQKPNDLSYAFLRTIVIMSSLDHLYYLIISCVQLEQIFCVLDRDDLVLYSDHKK